MMKKMLGHRPNVGDFAHDKSTLLHWLTTIVSEKCIRKEERLMTKQSDWPHFEQLLSKLRDLIIPEPGTRLTGCIMYYVVGILEDEEKFPMLTNESLMKMLEGTHMMLSKAIMTCRECFHFLDSLRPMS